MPGSEFRLLPQLPREFKTYKVISPGKLGVALTKGWSPVATLNFDHTEKGVAAKLTRFLVGRGKKLRKRRRTRELPVLMYQQPQYRPSLVTSPAPPPVGPEPVPAAEPHIEQIDQFLTQLALMSPEEVLALHQKLRAERLPAEAAETKDVTPAEEAEVQKAMEELLGDEPGDDGTRDDDD